MRIGIQTISWGRQPRETIREMLGAIRDTGYEGAELAQHPQLLGPPQQLFDDFRQHGLVFLGASGGSLDERCDLVLKMATLQRKWRETLPKKKRKRWAHEPYAYLDEAGPADAERISQWTSRGCVLAVHPHMFKTIQTLDEAEEWIDWKPALRFLPDTAHLSVAGEDVVEALRRNLHRTVGVHIKDWSSEVGRSYQFYSRGFSVEIGEGDVDVDKIIRFLKQANYGGWLIVEQDAVPDPVAAARTSRAWLRSRHGV